MNNFIEVHSIDLGKPVLINLSHVEEIIPSQDGVDIYFAFTPPGYTDQDYIKAEESYDKIKQLIWR